MYAYAVVVTILILLLVRWSPSSPSSPERFQEQTVPTARAVPPPLSVRVHDVSKPTIPLFAGARSNDSPNDYCPYRALIGTWRTSPSRESVPELSKEYRFSTAEDGKKLLLTVRHLQENPQGYGAPIAFDRGTCILSDFVCTPGLAGDITVQARCIQNPARSTVLNTLSREFKIVVHSNSTVLVDSSTGEEYKKV